MCDSAPRTLEKRHALTGTSELVDPMPGILNISTCRIHAGKHRDQLLVENTRLHTSYHIPWNRAPSTELVCHVQKLHFLILPSQIYHESLNGKHGQLAG